MGAGGAARRSSAGPGWAVFVFAGVVALLPK